LYGTDTSGYVGSDQLPEGTLGASHAMSYAGSQPSIVRAALRQLPSVEGHTFLDLGCGKGRALLVASEFPFKAIVGVELNPALATIAESNAEIIKQREPGRTCVRVSLGDATTFPLPDGNLILFLYHPFDAQGMAKIVDNVEAALANQRREIIAIYGNPVHADCFDRSPVLFRRFASMIPYSQDEIGFGPDESDAVAIWHGGPAVTPTTMSKANIVVEGNIRARIITSAQLGLIGRVACKRERAALSFGARSA
jgi:SAM-dependent methyltransferase